MSKKIVIIGGGGHASVLLDMLKKNGQQVHAFVSITKPKNALLFAGIQHWDSDDQLMSLDPKNYSLINGIGAAPKSNLRQNISRQYENLGFDFISVISSESYISSYVTLGKAIQVMPGAIIQPGTTISDHAIINSGAVIEHDCFIENDCHIAPRVVLCGGVRVGKGTYIGANSTIIQGIDIPANSVIGAGVIINKNFSGSKIFYPARPYARRVEDDC